MKNYFSEIKKILNGEKNKPVSIEMENIVWDSKKDSEKEREYVKLLYQYPLDELYNEAELTKRFEAFEQGKSKDTLPNPPGIFTKQGKLVLLLVKEKVQQIAQDHINSLIGANKKVKAAF